MLKTGDTAPAFSLPDQSGNLMSLADFTGGRALVLYFYPADFTPG
jgi:peroxiredoxin Q/BCP